MLAVLLRGSPWCPRLCRALPGRAFYPVRHRGGFLWRATHHGAIRATALCARAWGRAAALALCVLYRRHGSETLPAGTQPRGGRPPACGTNKKKYGLVEHRLTCFSLARGGLGLRWRAPGRTAATA
ncbi:MAG: hypothetical protein J3K34DRAFT_446583 [Monoraphidium minutum]|nr:MAG: hypothetical protein J3K34DRAFT_446583 [Monoraphidium minutum]